MNIISIIYRLSSSGDDIPINNRDYIPINNIQQFDNQRYNQREELENLGGKKNDMMENLGGGKLGVR